MRKPRNLMADPHPIIDTLKRRAIANASGENTGHGKHLDCAVHYYPRCRVFAYFIGREKVDKREFVARLDELTKHDTVFKWYEPSKDELQ